MFSVAGNPLIRFVTTEVCVSTTAGDYTCAAEAETAGPVVCNSGTLTFIATPVTGLTAVTNSGDAVIGTTADTDPQLRTRRETELRATGSGTYDSLKADLFAIQVGETKPVLDVQIFANELDTIDALGVPPHSFEALIYDGTGLDVPNDTLAQTIWDSKPAGIRPVGSSSGTAVDSIDTQRIIRFSRPTVLRMVMAITLSTDSDYVGNAAAKAAVVAKFLATVRQGGVSRMMQLAGACTDLKGVLDVTNIQIGVFGSTVGAHLENYTFGTRQIGKLETADISITT